MIIAELKHQGCLHLDMQVRYSFQLWCTLCGLLLLPFSSRAQGKPKALFIIADGIAADMLERHPSPALKRMAAAGTYMRAFVGGEKGAYTQSPTISAVGYNSLLTGTWANKHNVWDNNIDSPNYSYPSIFRLFKEAYPTKTIGIFSTWTDNRTKLAGVGLAQTNGLAFDYVSDGYELDTLRYPHDGERNFIHLIDEKVVADAAAAISTHGPDLSWVYLEYTDDMGHRWGDSPQMEQAITYLDRQIALLDAAISEREKKYKEDWLVLITTDHGRDSATGKHHGGQSNRERTTWIISNKQLDNAYVRQHTPGVVDIYPTLARHLKMALPQTIAREMDGVLMTGPVSIAAAQAAVSNDSLVVKWAALEPKGNVRIWWSAEDKHRLGFPDAYRLLGTTPVSSARFATAIPEMKGYGKVVIEGAHNSINCWVSKDGVFRIGKEKGSL